MKKLTFVLCFCYVLFGCDTKPTAPPSNHDSDIEVINKTIQDWDVAWETKKVDLAIRHYSDSIDWTNAFGARVQSKDDLEALLTRIFNMDFVMAGENNYGENEITFMTDSIVKVRSQNIRKNQKWPNGSKMDDRYINHLRIYQKIDGVWLITDHMISQAWPRQAN